jgi:hypothetical protein
MVSGFAVAQCGQVMTDSKIMAFPKRRGSDSAPCMMRLVTGRGAAIRVYGCETQEPSDHPTLTTIQLSRRSLPLHLHTDKSDLLAGKREAQTAWQCAEPKVLPDSFTRSLKINARFCQFCSGTRSVWRGRRKKTILSQLAIIIRVRHDTPHSLKYN